MPEIKKTHKPNIRNLILYILLPLVLGTIMSAFVPQPIIGIIEVRDPIFDATGKQLVEQVQYAQENNRIKAVVLVIDCPGGTVNDTELVFLELVKLTKKKPVVSMVQGLSASGAYYLSMAADEIISNPSAMIGNVGVIAGLPDTPYIEEDMYSTGPYKLWGSSRDAYIRQIEGMKNAFLRAVEFGRGDRLTIPLTEVSRGAMYPASEAVELGMIDEIGAQSDAIELAAKKALIAHYKIIDLKSAVSQEKIEAGSFFATDEKGKSTGYPSNPGFYYLFVPDFGGDL